MAEISDGNLHHLTGHYPTESELECIGTYFFDDVPFDILDGAPGYDDNYRAIRCDSYECDWAYAFHNDETSKRAALDLAKKHARLSHPEYKKPFTWGNFWTYVALIGIIAIIVLGYYLAFAKGAGPVPGERPFEIVP